MRHDEYVRKVQIIRVVDGDTIDVRIDLGWHLSMVERVRLSEVDTPEIRGPERPDGLVFKEMVTEWLSQHDFYWLRSVKYETGKYGRTVGEIFNPAGESLNMHLLSLL